MASYFGYVERKPESYINWAEIGKGMTDMLATESKRREDIKADIDKKTLDYSKMLYDTPQGSNTTINEWALDFSANAQEARLLQDKLLKSGKLSMKDYLVQRQNLMDGTTQSFGLIKESQQIFADKWERMKQGKSQLLEQHVMEELEGFGNFSKTRLYVNPIDGKVSVAFMDEEDVDGKKIYKMSKNPNKFSDINTLRNRVKTNFDKFDVSANMTNFVKGLGSEIKTVELVQAQVGKNGLLSEVLDITQRDNLPASLQGVVNKFEVAETKMLKSFLSNSYNTSSILTEELRINEATGEPYKYTWDDNEAKSNPNAILLKNENGMIVPKFTAAQEEAALDYLRVQARMRYDKKQETKVTPALADIDYERKKIDADIEVQKRMASAAETNAETNALNARTNARQVDRTALDNFEKMVQNKSLLNAVQQEIKGYNITGKNGLVNMNQLGAIMNKLGGYNFDMDISDDGKLLQLIFPNGEKGEVIKLGDSDAPALIKTEILAGIISAANGKSGKQNEFELND